MKHFSPNLFIPGAAKSGTSTLHNLLDMHPDICMSKLKEPVYWDSPEFIKYNLKKKKNGTQINLMIKKLLFLLNQLHHICFILTL